MSDPSKDVKAQNPWQMYGWIALFVLVGIWAGSSHYEDKLRDEELGSFGLAQVAAACRATPVTADALQAEQALFRLRNADFDRLSMRSADLLDQIWFEIYLNIITAFRSESWAQPDVVDLEWQGTDYSDAVIGVLRVWYADAGPEPGDWIRAWSRACAELRGIP